MKNRKRNIALLSVLMCVVAAVLLNWSYNNRWGKADRVMAAAEDELMAEANAATSASFPPNTTLPPASDSRFNAARVAGSMKRSSGTHSTFQTVPSGTVNKPSFTASLFTKSLAIAGETPYSSANPR